MEIGDRIKQKRESLNMSQEELANKVGYKSRSSINKIELDGRGLPQSKIVAFAKALETTPAYLMGWEPSVDYIVEVDSGEKILLETHKKRSILSSENILELRMLELFRSLSDIGKKKALDNIEDLSKIYSLEHILPDAANQRTDIELPQDTDISDSNIMDGEKF